LSNSFQRRKSALDALGHAARCRDLKGTAPAAARDLQRVTAAGSVIVLADGIVANARMAQVQPPAPGFVYER
jgi:hypothetical protein